jgi:hypothetical protein
LWELSDASPAHDKQHNHAGHRGEEQEEEHDFKHGLGSSHGEEHRQYGQDRQENPGRILLRKVSNVVKDSTDLVIVQHVRFCLIYSDGVISTYSAGIVKHKVDFFAPGSADANAENAKPLRQIAHREEALKRKDRTASPVRYSGWQRGQ